MEVDAVSDTVDRAAKLTAQLLAFARRQALKPEVFDARERIRGIAQMIDSLTGARIRIVTTLAEGNCAVRADPDAPFLRRWSTLVRSCGRIL